MEGIEDMMSGRQKRKRERDVERTLIGTEMRQRDI